MSYKYRSSLDREQLPLRHCVRVHGCNLVFKNATDAASAYKALSKALGQVRSKSFEFTSWMNGKSTAYENVIDADLELALVQERHGEEAEVEGAINWERVTRCDGTGVCGCWHTEDGHATPDEWMDYVKDGVTMHMCPSCQSKEVKLEAPKPQC